MLAYEVDSDNVLHVDLSWTAVRDGDKAWFPCPYCGGRNIVEPCVRPDGRPGHRVARFEPAPAAEDGSEGDGDLDLIPRGVRDRLDRVGVKLHLAEWRQLSLADRKRLCTLPCTTPEEVQAYRRELERMVQAATGRMPERLPGGE